MSDLAVSLAPIAPVPAIDLVVAGAPVLSLTPVAVPAIRLTPSLETPLVILSDGLRSLPVPLVTLGALDVAPSVTFFDQTGNALDPATHSVQIALQAFMRGPAGQTPDLTILVHGLPQGDLPSVTKTGTVLEPTFDIGIPSLPGSFIDEFQSAVDGLQTRTYGQELSLSTAVYINGLRQASTSFEIDGTNLTLPDTLNIRTGDAIIVAF